MLANRFDYVVEHMCSRLLTAAFSPILRDFYDFAGTIAGPPASDYATPAMSNSIVLFTGTMTDSVRNTIEEYGPERLQPGDVIVANDPYRTGTHVNDMLFVRPVFHDGEILAFANLKAHQLDMGGAVPGGFSCTKRTVYENGLVLSPRALFSAGEPVRETWSLIFDNVRFGEILFPDMQTIVAGLDLGERLIVESAERYGAEALRGTIDYVCDANAERIAEALAELPDGRWEGWDMSDCDGVDDGEEYRVQVAITKRDDRLEVDFSGTSRQARTCINATALDVKTTVGVAVKYLLDPRGAFTSGLYRNIDIVLPEGTVISALPPDGAVFAYYEQSQVMLSALLRAFAGVRGRGRHRRGPRRHRHPQRLRPAARRHAVGLGGPVRRRGRPVRRHPPRRRRDADVLLSGQRRGDRGRGDRGRRPGRDAAPRAAARQRGPGAPPRRRGDGARHAVDGAHRAPPHVAARQARRGLRGAGRARRAPRRRVGLRSAGGGVEGAPGTEPEAYREATPLAGVVDPETKVLDPDGTYVYPFPPAGHATPPGAILRYVNAGGGGWGDPLQRDPEAVKRDVRDGYVSIEGAARDYGVVIAGDPDEDPEGLALDLAATERLRADRGA